MADQPKHATLNENELWLAYERTVFRADVDGVSVNIRPGHHDPALDRVLAARGLTTWAFITAWNPGSRPLSTAVNRRRQHDLEADLRSAGFEIFDGAGEPCDASWPPEESVLILGIPEATAVQFGQQYGQRAIVAGECAACARLLRCD